MHDPGSATGSDSLAGRSFCRSSRRTGLQKICNKLPYYRGAAGGRCAPGLRVSVEKQGMRHDRRGRLRTLYRTVTPEAAGSSPVHPPTVKSLSYRRREAFCFGVLRSIGARNRGSVTYLSPVAGVTWRGD